MRWAGCAARWRGARSAGWRPPCRRSRRWPPTASSPPGASARSSSLGGWGEIPGPFGIKNMAEVRLVDVSLRDGNQSLWGATGLRTEHIVQIAPVLNRVGFRALDFMSSTAMGVAVRTHREDPWERIRLTQAAMPDTPLQLIGTGFRFISWERAHPEVMQLVYERLVAAGISRFVLLDPMHDMDAVRRSARMVKRAGGTETILALTYTISAVHDDDFYAAIAAAAAASPYIDRAYINDPAGLLTPKRARKLTPDASCRVWGNPVEQFGHGATGKSRRVPPVTP